MLRHDGMRYEVSPWALAWDDENYYMIAYDHTDERIKHYRVDKMVKIILTSKPRKGQEKFDEKNSPKYSQKLFSMFGGEPVRVSIEADDSMAGVFIDRFGKDIMIVPKKDGRFRLTVEVEVSDHFLGWIIALGPSVVITGPPQVIGRMKEIAETLKTQYL